jgi:hypothetical protein
LIYELIGKRNLLLERKKRFLGRDETGPDFVFILFGEPDFLFFKPSRVLTQVSEKLGEFELPKLIEFSFRIQRTKFGVLLD